jgi:hypothetical protein
MRVKEFLKESVAVALIQNSAPSMLYEAVGQHFLDILNEASSLTAVAKNNPYVPAILKTLHRDLDVSHDQEWKQTDKVNWVAVKDSAPNYVIMIGHDGVAAIRWASGTYKLVTSNKDGIDTISSISSINTASSDIKQAIGKIKEFWVTPETLRNAHYTYHHTTYGTSNKVTDLRDERAARRKLKNPSMYDSRVDWTTNSDVLARKLLPLYHKYVQQALADVKGSIGIAIKNDGFDRAITKARVAKKLQNLSDWFENNKGSSLKLQNLPNEVSGAIRAGILMAASYYYPEETGNVTRRGGYHAGGVSMSSVNDFGPNKLVKDIINGDSAKLATVMNFVKQEVVHGY